MYRVSIVEDNENAGNTLIKYLKEYELQRDMIFKVSLFKDALDFLQSFRNNYDLIFMDIELPDINGMEVVRKIRAQDSKVIVIFVTNMAQYAIRGYEVDAMDFIVKPVSYSAFAIKLDRAVQRLKSIAHKVIWINERTDKRRLRVEDIKYVEVAHHNVIYHTTEGNYTTYDQLNNVQNVLEPYKFALCNRYLLVNLRFVTAIEEFSVTVAGEKLQISRNKKKSFLISLNEYLGGN